MSSRVGIVDLGTNTFHVLIAEVDGPEYSFVYKEKIHVALGKGGINQGLITNEASERAMAAMNHIREILARFQVDHVRCVATSALRNAKNSNEFLNQIAGVGNLDIEVICGDKEAEYIFEGISLGLDLNEHSSLVMDIGGGSVEFIIGSNMGISWQKSFEIGAQRIVDRFQHNDPITFDQISRIEEYFQGSLQPLHEALEKFSPKTLVGSSGTFDTFSEIYRRKNNIQIISKQSEFPLTMDAIESIHKEIIIKNRSERMKIPGMVEMRVDLIIVASILIQSVLRMNSFEEVRVSSYSLKEGIFSQYLKSQKFAL